MINGMDAVLTWMCDPAVVVVVSLVSVLLNVIALVVASATEARRA